MPSRAFATYLGESLDQIERGAPEVYALVARRLGARVVHIVVGGEALGVRVEGARLLLDLATEGDRAAAIEARTERADIVALVDGEVTLEEAVTTGRVELWGSVEDLLAGLDALGGYLNGAARCPELGGLMEAFRRDAAGGYPGG